jgi:peptidoglycan/LPS O-acetylase OafA/YrhL
MKKELKALTGLRLIAAIAIVLDHMWPVVMKLNPEVPYEAAFHQLQFVGMSLFFVLSGFIIHYNYSGIVNSIRGIYEFGVARFSRLYPLLFLLVVFDIVCNNFFLFAGETDRWEYIQDLPYILTGTQSWFYKFIGNHPIAFTYHYSFVAWSISTEFFLYLTYPVICFFTLRADSVRSSSWLVGVVVTVSVATLAFLKAQVGAVESLAAHYGIVENSNAAPDIPFAAWFSYISPYPRVLEFATGVVIAQLLSRLGRVLVVEKTISSLICAAAWLYLTAFVLQKYIPSRSLTTVIAVVGLLPPIAIIIFCTARYDLLITRALSAKMIAALGEASYSIYLLHLIVIDKTAPTAAVDATPENIGLLSAKVVMNFIIIAILSLGTHYYFEMPMRKWLRKLLSFENSRLSAHAEVVSVDSEKRLSS